ncbi:MAG: hypothetical protein K6B72_04050 [Lachnospiraceae bacterium]|nr:hypothetical protein [Lachnospiraceae bacterium]
MLAEKKVILMTRMAMFKRREGRRDDAAGRYFQTDYIAHHIIGSVVCATAVFLVLCALYILSHFDLLMQDIYSADLTEFLTKTIRIYVIFTVLYCLFSAVIYTVRYYRMQRRVRAYAAGLRRLAEMTDKETAASAAAAEDEGTGI